MLTDVQQLVLDAVQQYDGVARYSTVAYKLGLRIFELRLVLEEIQANEARPVDVQFGQTCVFVSTRAAA